MMIIHRKIFPAETVDERKRRLALFDLILTRLLYLVMSFFLALNFFVLLANAHQSGHTLDKVVDCTTPKHTCYENGRRQTGAAILKIEQIIVAANYCTKDNHNLTVHDVTLCVSRIIGP